MSKNREIVGSEATLRMIIDMSPDAMMALSAAGIILFANPAAERLFERSAAEMIGTEFGFPVTGEEITEIEVFSKSGVLQTAEMRLVNIEWEGEKGVLLTLRDITERKKLEDQQRLANTILNLLNRSQSCEDTICKLLTELKRAISFDAVAIRLHEGDDFPYYATDGFSEDFLRTERFLCAHNQAGEIERDSSGNPVLECMCGNILRGRFNPELPFFTKGGSFWTNSTTRLLATTTETDRQARTRNRCHGEDYESVALIPLRTGQEIIGLLQLNDHRPDRFTAAMIDFFESLAGSIGVALARKKLQEQLIEKKDFIEKALNSLQDLFFVFDLEGNFLRWNKSLSRVSGYLDTEIDSMTPLDFFHKEDRERVTASIQTAIQQGNASLEALLVTKDGRQIPYDFNSMWLSDSHGSPIGISGVGRDITERKHTEHNLRERIKEIGCINTISRLANNSSISIDEFVRDAVGVLPSGWQYPEICAACITLNSTEFKTANFRETAWRQTADIQVNRKKFGTVTICYLAEKPTADAGPFLKEERSLLDIIADLLGHIIQHRLIEAEIRTSEEKFRIIFDSTHDGILLADIESKKFHFANATICRMLGYDQEEINNLGVMDIHPEKDLPSVLEQFAKQSRNERVVALTLPLKRKDGSVFFADIHASPVEISGKKYLLGIFIDITERQALEAQLRHSQKMDSIGTLAGGIAHDFNNILNVIMGYGDMVMESLAIDNPSREDMSEVLVAADRAAQLTRRLLVFSRKEVAELSSVNINALILDLQKMLVRILRENIELHLGLTDTPLIVLADTGQMEQVLVNLIANARDAMLEGGMLTINTGLAEINEAFIAAAGYGEPGKYALITVADTGQGMDAETLQKIFEPFFTTKRIGEGTGLGLAISYGIIKQHNGYIRAYSEPGVGTVFKIFLPLCDEGVLDKKLEGSAPVMGGRETILVVEDDVGLRELNRKILESFGYTVITAVDGEEGIAKFLENRERINLVLLDMIMPKKDGKEVSAAIRKISPKMKILFASGYTMEIPSHKELEERGFDFIQKPYSSKILLVKVREVLDK